MTRTLLQGATLEDVVREIGRMVGAGIISPSVRRLAEEAKGSVTSVYDFIKATFPYVPDPYGYELFIAPNRMAEDYYSGRVRGGDCDDLSMLTAAALGSVGFETRVMLIATSGGMDVDHALAQVRTPELGWLNLDVTSSHPLGWVLRGWRTFVYPN